MLPCFAPPMRFLMILFLFLFLWSPLALAVEAADGGGAQVVVMDVVLPVVASPTAPAPVELLPEVDQNGFRTGDPTDALDLLEKAVTTRNFFFGAAAILMLLTVVVKRKWSAIPPDMIPAVTLVLTAIPGLILVLMRPGVNAAMVGKQVFVIWLMTSGSWEAIGKRLFETWIPKIKLAMTAPAQGAPPPPPAQGAPAAPVAVPAGPADTAKV